MGPMCSWAEKPKWGPCDHAMWVLTHCFAFGGRSLGILISLLSPRHVVAMAKPLFIRKTKISFSIRDLGRRIINFHKALITSIQMTWKMQTNVSCHNVYLSIVQHKSDLHLFFGLSFTPFFGPTKYGNKMAQIHWRSMASSNPPSIFGLNYIRPTLARTT